MMRTKRLGRTEMQLPIVGIGTAFTGIPTQNQTVRQYEGAPSAADRDLGVETLVAAMDAGCRFFDTAVLYGNSISETMIGEALRQRPALKDEMVITTKAGRTHEFYDYSFDFIVRSVNDSLERMGLDSVDIVYIHDAMGQPLETVLAADGALGALRHLQKQGLLRHVGTAANDPPTNLQYIKTGEFDAAVIADSWSLINLTAERGIFAAAAEHDVGLVAATPVERGLLVTGPQANTKYLNRIFSQACLDHVSRIKAVCERHDLPMLAVALQWCTRHPQVASTIPGARVPKEAESSMAAARLEIPDALWSELQSLVEHFDTALSV